MNLPILTPGFDPTVAPTTPTNSQLLQMVAAAHVASGIGIIYWGATAPSLITYPDAETVLWGKLDGSGDPTGEFFYWDGTATWEAFTITELDGSKLVDGSVTADKFSTTGASAGDIFYFNGTAWTLAAIVNSITDNTLPISKIVKPSSGSKQVLYYNGSTLEWYNLTGADIIALLSNGSVPIAKLAAGGARYVARTNAAGTAVEYAAPSTLFTDYELSPLVIATDTEALSISSGTITLDAESGNGGPAFTVTLNANITDFSVINLQSGRDVVVVLVQNGTGGYTVVWDAAIEWLNDVEPAIRTAPAAKTVVRFTNINGTIYGLAMSVGDSAIRVTADIALPTVDGDAITPVEHELGAVPRYVNWRIVCNAVDSTGYAIGDEIDLHEVVNFWAAGNEYSQAFTAYANETELGLGWIATGSGLQIGMAHKTTRALTQLTPSYWRLKCYYSL
jgi:hypothetical protein